MGMRQSGAAVAPSAIQLQQVAAAPMLASAAPRQIPDVVLDDPFGKADRQTGALGKPQPPGLFGRAADAYLAASAGSSGSLASQEADNAQAAMQAAAQGRIPSYGAPRGGMDLQTL